MCACAWLGRGGFSVAFSPRKYPIRTAHGGTHICVVHKCAYIDSLLTYSARLDTRSRFCGAPAKAFACVVRGARSSHLICVRETGKHTHTIAPNGPPRNRRNGERDRQREGERANELREPEKHVRPVRLTAARRQTNGACPYNVRCIYIQSICIRQREPERNPLVVCYSAYIFQ